MNLAEKLAATYLRLNGFLLLPHFTVFTGQQHNHVDLIALRAANSVERVGANILATDDRLFDALTNMRGKNARSDLLGIVAEVRTNDRRNTPTEEHVEYVAQFLGGLPMSRLAFHEAERGIYCNGREVDIGIHYAGTWIQNRIDSMEGQRLTKEGSWNWSESFLSDFLVLRKAGLTQERN
jgi:hypothetical protein